ncbi:hypothetical protein KCP75_22305 [Salmonella enterica subsp. enterica]|nr:hypothetical protein KCP75_22305 [Salmonella enterica subsp. enterica]
MPRVKSEAAAAVSPLINLGFGTFVESAHPFMFANKIVLPGHFWAGMGGMMLGFNVKGVVCVPAFASPFHPAMRSRFTISYVIATMADDPPTSPLLLIVSNLSYRANQQRQPLINAPTPEVHHA